jgi:hypothetical protein
MNLHDARHFIEHKKRTATSAADAKWLAVADALEGEIFSTRDEMQSVQEELDDAISGRDCYGEDED